MIVLKSSLRTPPSRHVAVPLAVILLVAACIPSVRHPETFRIEYTVSVKDTAAQLFRVAASFGGLTESHLELALPTYTPGSFGTGNYVGNVRDLQAVDESGRPLRVEQSRPSAWRVARNGAARITVEFDYRAAVLSSDQARIASDYAFFTGTQLFLEPIGYREQPSTVRFVVPRGWRIVTPLIEGADSTTFLARNYDELVDAPTVLGHFDVVSFDVDGKRHQFVTVPKGAYAPTHVDSFVRWIPPIIRQQRAIFGSLPYEKYVFFYIKPSSESPAAGGVEHATAHVVLGLNETLGGGMLSLLSHEFFHLWNTKRIRPAERWPYDYAREQPTPSLWASEGMTSYYGELTKYRAAVAEGSESDTTLLLRELAYRLSGIESRTTGGGAAAAAPDAPWVSRNEYWTGEILGALLDISVLSDTRGRRRLDDVFRKLYTDYFQRGRGYAPSDLPRVVSAVAGRDYTDFFRRHIAGPEPPPYDSIFALAGYQLVRRSRALAVVQGLLNASRVPAGRQVNVVRAGSPAAVAGIARGDLILSVGGTPVNELELVNLFGENWIGGAFAGRPGPSVLKVSRDGVVRDVPIVLATRDDRRLEIQSVETPNRDQLALRAAWLRR